MKGILNKMTVDKLDKLFEQLAEFPLASDVEAARALVAMILDKAAFDSTHCGTFADVCARLHASLPAYAVGDATTTFKKMLLAACQDDFEASDASRDGLSLFADRSDREMQAKRINLRTVGTIRLIGECFKRGVFGAAVVHAIADELLGEARSTPCEDYIEALCALLTACGKELETGAKKTMDMYIARLNVLSESEHVEARTRFMCRDVIELRGKSWVSRAKKHDDSRKSARDGDDLTVTTAVVSDEILFPQGPKVPRGGKHAPLSGPYQAPARVVVFPTAKNRVALENELRRDAMVSAEAKADAAMNAASGGASTSEYTSEQVDQKIKSFMNEYCTVGDVSEALMCVADLLNRTPDADATRSEIAKALVDHVVNESSAKTADLIGKLLVACYSQSGFSTSDIECAVGDVVSMAPKLLAKVVAAVVGANAVAPDFITAAGGCIEDVMYRREFAGACLVELKSAGFAGLTPGALNLAEFAAGEDADETVAQWLAKLSLSELA
jgi:translation initiation factor 4G